MYCLIDGEPVAATCERVRRDLVAEGCDAVAVVETGMRTSDGVEPRATLGGPVRVAAGYACSILAVFCMNRFLFPQFDAVFTYARDISITVEALALIALAVVAMWRPATVRARVLNGCALAMMVVGAALLAVGLGGAGAPALVVGACLAVTGRAWMSIVVYLAAAELADARTVYALLGGTLVATACEAFADLVPAGAGIVLSVVVLPLAMLALCGRGAGALMGQIRASEPVVEVSVTRPSSFLPLTHMLYVFQFVMFVAYGFALRFGEVEGSPAFGAVLAAGAVVVLLAIVLARRGDLPFDGLCDALVLVLLAGFMLVIGDVARGPYVANSVLVVGSSLYNLLIACTLVALASRNRVTALSIFCWASGLAALGTTLGALVGTTGNAWVAQGRHDDVVFLVGAVALLLVGYALVFQRGFSFRATIAGVEEPAVVADEAVAPSDEELFDAACMALAREHGLTPREAETFAMLARGRNREYIENALTVSRNTVKAHVKHVYAKLDIHSHQELLDLVEARMAGARGAGRGRSSQI